MSNDSMSATSDFDELFKVNSVEYIKRSDDKSDTEIENIFKRLAELDNNNVKKDGCKYLIKILENILLDPSNLKTRRIRISNDVFTKYISNNGVLLKLFVSFGFVVVKEFYVLQVVEFHKLVNAYKQLIFMLDESFGLKHRSMESHFFDPFKSYKHNANVYANSESFELVSKDLTKIGIDEVYKDISERQDIASTLDDWNPSIKQELSPVRPSKIAADSNDSFSPSTASLIKMYNIGKNENFESKSKKELETLKTKSEHAKRCPVVELKIRLPKSTTLLIHVPVKSPVRTVRSNIQKILLDDVSLEDWHLVEFPIRRRINDDRTLLEEGIMFKSVLHFTFKEVQRNNYQVVKSEFLEKYKPRD
nr:hypothetical protein MACL_00003090 [Theileria orientalis]